MPIYYKIVEVARGVPPFFKGFRSLSCTAGTHVLGARLHTYTFYNGPQRLKADLDIASLLAEESCTHNIHGL